MSAKEEFEQFVVPCLVELVSALRPSLLLDHLRQDCLIDESEYFELHAISTEEDRSRKLLLDFLPRELTENSVKFFWLLKVKNILL